MPSLAGMGLPGMVPGTSGFPVMAHRLTQGFAAGVWDTCQPCQGGPHLCYMLEASGPARGKLLRGRRFCDSDSLAGVLPEGNLPLVGLVARALGSWNTMSGSGQAAVHSSAVCAPH